jgi:hypothetical protein
MKEHAAAGTLSFAAGDHRVSLYEVLFAIMYDHYVDGDPGAVVFKWIEPRANLIRFDSFLSRREAQQLLALGDRELAAEAAFVLLYEGCARYRAEPYVFSAEDLHHLYRVRHGILVGRSDAMRIVDAEGDVAA